MTNPDVSKSLTRSASPCEPLSLLIAEPHHVPLHGTLFRGHDASPSLRSHRFGDSPQDQGRGVLGLHVTKTGDSPLALSPTTDRNTRAVAQARSDDPSDRGCPASGSSAPRNCGFSDAVRRAL